MQEIVIKDEYIKLGQALKLAGFTLEEIQKLNNGCDENAVLLKKKSELLSKIADLTKQLSIVETFLTKKADTISSPVLIKKIPKVTVAAMKSTIESYDDLFELMPKMGALMEKAGCVLLYKLHYNNRRNHH